MVQFVGTPVTPALSSITTSSSRNTAGEGENATRQALALTD